MNIRNIKISFVLSLGLLSHVSNAADPSPIFADNFDSGALQSFWNGTHSVSVSNERPKDGAYSSRWRFRGGAPDQDAFSELRFDLGQQYPELTITFDWYIPANYYHRDSPGSDNNKFLRMWSNTYSDSEKMGASTYPQANGNSIIGEDYRKQAGWGMSTGVTTSPSFITETDRGKWMAVRIYVKAATDNSPGIFRLYKNGKLQHETTKMTNNHTPGTQGYRYGYLLGWANSGYDNDTVFYIDNVKFFSQNAAIATPPADEEPSPPQPPKLVGN